MHANFVVPKIVIPPEEVSYGKYEREEPVRVKVVAARGSRVEVEGDPVAIGIGVYVRVYDERLPDESGQRM